MKTYTDYIKEGKINIFKSKPKYISFNNFIGNVKYNFDIHNIGITVDRLELKDLNGIEKFEQLRTFSCKENEIVSLEPLKNLTHLENVYINTNKITNLEPLQNSINLISLFCYENQITSLEPLNNLINLTHLYCYFNELQSFKGLPENVIYFIGYRNPLNNWGEDVDAFVRAYKSSYSSSKKWFDKQERFAEIIDLIKINMI